MPRSYQAGTTPRRACSASQFPRPSPKPRLPFRLNLHSQVTRRLAFLPSHVFPSTSFQNDRAVGQRPARCRWRLAFSGLSLSRREIQFCGTNVRLAEAPRPMSSAKANSGNAQPPQPLPDSPPAQAFGRRVNRSCMECTRRKIKCDGRFPCSSCVYYRAAEACEYRQRSRRNAVSRR